jgi:hypothetical protein
MARELTDIFCPYCDNLEQGKTQSRMLNKQSGWICTVGHKFKNYDDLMRRKPRMDKLKVIEKQPQGSTIHPMWIHPQALAALQERFPSNFRTTIYSLFNALADPDSILIEAEHCRELRKLGISKGKDIIGLAKTNLALEEQLKLQDAEMKQYQFVANLIRMTNGGGGMAGGMAGGMNLGAGGGFPPTDPSNPQPQEKPPHNPVLPMIDTESDEFAVPVEPGSFSDGSLSQHILPAPPLVQAAQAFGKIRGR